MKYDHLPADHSSVHAAIMRLSGSDIRSEPLRCLVEVAGVAPEERESAINQMTFMGLLGLADAGFIEVERSGVEGGDVKVVAVHDAFHVAVDSLVPAAKWLRAQAEGTLE